MSARNVGWFMAGVLAVISASCGGGGGSADPAPSPPPVTARTNLLVLGNSLTYLPVDATYVPGSRDWGQGGWGMAASRPEKDFVHLVASAQALPFIAMNLADNERDAATPLPAFTIGAGTVVVLQLGDNGLPARYAELVQRAKGGARLVCLSTYWKHTDRDDVMRPLCEAAGGRWVFIGDLQVKLGLYDNPGVDMHPGDAQMAQIAARVNAALKD